MSGEKNDNAMDSVISMIVNNTLNKHEVKPEMRTSSENSKQLLEMIKILEDQSKKYIKSAQRRKNRAGLGATKFVPQNSGNSENGES